MSLFLPVFHKGAQFYVGDPHSAQGDGEVNGTALEHSLTGTFRFVVHKGRTMQLPRAETATHYVVMGIDVDLDRAMRIATQQAIDFLIREKGLSASDAYALASIGCDFHVAEAVDLTQVIVGKIPKALFRGKRRQGSGIVGGRSLLGLGASPLRRRPPSGRPHLSVQNSTPSAAERAAPRHGDAAKAASPRSGPKASDSHDPRSLIFYRSGLCRLALHHRRKSAAGHAHLHQEVVQRRSAFLDGDPRLHRLAGHRRLGGPGPRRAGRLAERREGRHPASAAV